VSRRARTARLLASLLALAAGSCGDPPLLDLRVVTTDGVDPLTGVDKLRLVVTEPASETTASVTSTGTFSVELKVEVASGIGEVILEGSRGGSLVARGESPPMVLTPTDRQLSVLVGRAGELAALRTRLPSPGDRLVAVLLPSRGILVAGGADKDNRAGTGAALYDFFQQTLTALPALPEGRVDAVGADCGGSCAVIALGAKDGGFAEQLLRWEDSSGWTAIADKLAPPDRRRGAGIASLDADTYLIAGGEGPAGPLDTALRLTPGDALSDPTLEVLPARTRAARRRPAMASGTGTVIVVGGQPAGGPAFEIYYTTSSSFQALPVGASFPASGSAVTDLGDGRFAVVGGRDESGALLRAGWIIDPVTLQVTPVLDALAEGRADHALVRAGKQLLVVGGALASGLASKVEVLEAKTLKHLGDTPMLAPRSGFATARLGPGSFLVAGGRGAAGSTPIAAPIDLVEVFETAEPYGQ